MIAVSRYFPSGIKNGCEESVSAGLGLLARLSRLVVNGSFARAHCSRDNIINPYLARAP